MSQSSILIFTRYYLPGFKAGGPIRSIKNIVSMLDSDYSIKIFTGDRDVHDQSPYDLELNRWLGSDFNNHLIRYNENLFDFKSIFKNIKVAEYVYLNSFFDPHFSIIPLVVSRVLRKQVVLAPRGEFAESALQIKGCKKKIYISFFRLFSFNKYVKWHATNPEEQHRVKSIFGTDSQVFVANNISAAPSENIGKKQRKPYLDLFFLARIAPMKNLQFALQVVSKLKVQVKFAIYGPVEDSNYWADCQKLIQKLPSNIQVKYSGSLKHDEITDTISRHDFLFLPTKGENFGHSIAECLSNGTPVIISNKTPWVGLKEIGIGWDISLNNMNGYLIALEEATLLSNADYSQMSERVMVCYKSIFTKQQAELKIIYFNLFSTVKC